MIVVGSYASALRGDYDLGRTPDDIDIFGVRADFDALAVAITEPVHIIDKDYKVFLRRTAYEFVNRGGLFGPPKVRKLHPPISIKFIPDDLRTAMYDLPDNMPVTLEGVPVLAISPLTCALAKQCLVEEIPHPFAGKHDADIAYLKAKNYFGFKLTPKHTVFMNRCRAHLRWEMATGKR